jgi:hypothetical protein
MKNLIEHEKWSTNQLKQYLQTLTNFRSVSTNLKHMKKNIIEKTYFLDEFYGPSVKFSTRIKTIINGYSCMNDIPNCSVCGLNKVIILKQDGSFSESCSPKCANFITMLKGKKTLLDTYGVEHQSHIPGVREKTVKTLRDTYGVEHQSHIPGVREKTVKTNNIRYGGNSPSCSPDVVEKILNTTEMNHGNRFYFLTEKFAKQTRDYNMRVYNVPHYSMTEEYKLKYRSTSLRNFKTIHHTQKEWSDYAKSVLEDKEVLSKLYTEYGGIKLGDMLGVNSDTVYSRLKKFGIEITKGTSAGERSLSMFIESLGVDVVNGDRTCLGGKEIDIFIPNHKIGFEFDGLFWHSSKFVDKNYHLNKTIEAMRNDVRLIHVFEDEWTSQRDLIKLKIKSLLGVDDRERVNARNTEVVIIPKFSCVNEFLDKHHIQGRVRSTFRFGLTYKGDLVACMTFVKRTDEEFELNRYATSHRVVGGFSKILSHAKRVLREHGVNTIVSFSDKRWSDGNMYLVNGWNHEYDTKPDYQYVINDKRFRKQKFRRKNLPNILERFDKDLSEVENMRNHGIYQIYDCGLMKFRMDL